MRQAVSSALKERTRFYFLYTLLFGLFSIALFSPFLVTGKSLIWQTDGLAQHFNAFVYLGTWMREILKNLIFEHQLIIPMWEFSIGYGADVLTTLQYYVLGDPVALFSVVTPSAYAEEMYCLLILFRLYLAGIAFCAFCRKMECGRAASLCGAFAYAFCSFSIYAAVRHPYFASPMIYLPLILLGAEKILRKEKPIFYVAMIFVAAISNFYFFYMLVLLTVLYVAFRFFSLYKEQVWKNLGINLIKFIGFSVVGVLMACILFFPVCMAYLGDARASSDYVLSALYSKTYYEAFLRGFITAVAPGQWAYYGIAPIAFLGVLGFFITGGKKHLWLKLFYVLLTIFLLLPLAGYIFNGFGYVANRWVFAYAFFGAFLFTRAIPDLLTMPKKKKVILTLIVTIFSFLCFFLEISRVEATMASCVMLLLSLIVFLGANSISDVRCKYIHISASRIVHATILTLVLIGSFVNGFYRYSIAEYDYIAEFRDRNEAIDLLDHQRANALDLIEETDFYRVDQTANGLTVERNFLLSSGINSTSGYWSLQNSNIAEYLLQNSSYMDQCYIFKGLLSRALLLPFASASYFVCDAGQEKYVPYGYEYLGSKKTFEGNEVKLYHTDYSLPLGYTCDSWIPRETYDALSIPKKQQAMLQGAVVESEDQVALFALSQSQPQYRDEDLTYSMKPSASVEISEHMFTVKKPGGSVTLTFECDPNVELYAQFLNLSFESRNRYTFLTPEEYDEYTRYEQYKIERSMKFWTEADTAKIQASCDGVAVTASCFTEKSAYTHGRTDYLLNLNYSDKKRTTIKLTFDQPGIYTFDKLSVVSQPVDFLKEQTDAMKEDVLEEVEILPNTITGKISLDEEKLLCLSVPYSKGWTAFVDGKEQELLKTNVMYMGLPLSAGEHTIELRYTTPYLKEGILLSGIGFIAFLTIIVVYAVRKKKSA